MTDLSPAISLLIEYNSHFAYQDFSPIRMWLAEGADMEKDIMPTLRVITGRRKEIKTSHYFTEAVRRAMQSRLDTEKAMASKPNPGLSKEEIRAKTIAFAVRKLGRCMPTDERWLASYEAQHGVVA